MLLFPFVLGCAGVAIIDAPEVGGEPTPAACGVEPLIANIEPSWVTPVDDYGLWPGWLGISPTGDQVATSASMYDYGLHTFAG